MVSCGIKEQNKINMTIDNLINWLQEAEDNNTWLVSTQSVKRHLEKIKETEQLNIPIVVVPKGTLCCVCETKKANTGYDLKFCKECWEEED
jgi:hypothetical protein